MFRSGRDGGERASVVTRVGEGDRVTTIDERRSGGVHSSGLTQRVGLLMGLDDTTWSNYFR